MPWADLCFDVLGMNSLCPFYLSAREDCASFPIGGWSAWANPPFKCFDAIVRSIERQGGRYPATAVVLVLPVLDSNKSKAL